MDAGMSGSDVGRNKSDRRQQGRAERFRRPCASGCRKRLSRAQSADRLIPAYSEMYITMSAGAWEQCKWGQKQENVVLLAAKHKPATI